MELAKFCYAKILHNRLKYTVFLKFLENFEDFKCNIEKFSKF